MAKMRASVSVSEALHGSSEEEIGWITWFCDQPGNEYFCEVERDFIEDKFNLVGLEEQVLHYRPALNIILDRRVGLMTRQQLRAAEGAACLLYGLIHARYILDRDQASLAMTIHIFLFCYSYSKHQFPFGWKFQHQVLISIL